MQGKLALYADLVRVWARRINLVSRADLDEFEERHIADSLRLAPLTAELGSGTAVDVGSGAGLPGIPLAIAEPTRRWRLVEPRQKRAAFLELAVRTLELDCEVVVATAEQCARDPRLLRAHRFATARALAPPTRAFDLLLPLLEPEGVAAVWLGERAALPASAELWIPGVARMVKPNCRDGAS